MNERKDGGASLSTILDSFRDKIKPEISHLTASIRGSTHCHGEESCQCNEGSIYDYEICTDCKECRPSPILDSLRSKVRRVLEYLQHAQTYLLVNTLLDFLTSCDEGQNEAEIVLDIVQTHFSLRLFDFINFFENLLPSRVHQEPCQYYDPYPCN